MPILDSEGDSELLDDIADDLFEARATLVEQAEEHGYGHLFPGEQSISEMEEQIAGIEDDDVRSRLESHFELVENCYREYNVELAKHLKAQNTEEEPSD